jgi:hypothetical protein
MVSRSPFLFFMAYVRHARRREAELRHCEERSDEAIHLSLLAMDCFASLAMTISTSSAA